MSDDKGAFILTLAVDNAELRGQFATAQDPLVQVAADAGALHARIGELQAVFAEAHAERDA